MSKLRSAPTLDDVARMAGVSTATVSRCLNDSGRVVDETRQRVMKAVQALGYTPNFAARVMAAKRTFTIGAIIPTMENAMFARGLQAFQEELHSRGYTLLVASSAYDPDREQEQIRALVARGADGLLLIGQERSPDIYAYLALQKVPFLTAWAIDPGSAVPSIGFDNRAAMQALTQQVLSLGHRRIAMISGRIAGNDRARARVEGVRAALGAEFPLIEGPYEIDAGAKAMGQLMAHPQPPTAVLCGNDVLAVGALAAAVDLGLRVPQDVSITGFDDIDLARIVRPALTTVAVPDARMGQRAACELVDMVEGARPGQSQELPTTIQRRGSLGPCPGTT